MNAAISKEKKATVRLTRKKKKRREKRDSDEVEKGSRKTIHLRGGARDVQGEPRTSPKLGGLASSLSPGERGK